MSLPRPLRVVHVSSAHPATDSRIYEKECYSLAEAGYDVTLIATGSPPTTPAPVRVITSRPINRRLSRFVLGPLRALRAATRLQPDVIHLHDPELIPLGVLCRLTGYQVVFDSHEDIPESMAHKPYLPPAVRIGARVASQALVWLVNRSGMKIVSATPHIAKRFPRSAIVQNFPKLSDWQLAGPEAPTSGDLVYVGAISEPRGIWPMVEATALLREQGRDVQLKLAGPINAGLLERLRPHIDSNAVKYLGLLDRHEVATLLATSAVGLVLFGPSPNNKNGKPTKLFEYMAAGIPSVASDFPLWRDMVLGPDVGLVADPLSPTDISRSIGVLLDDPMRARAMGQRGRVWVESQRNWSLEAKTLMELYEGFAQLPN